MLPELEVLPELAGLQGLEPLRERRPLQALVQAEPGLPAVRQAKANGV